MSESLRPSTDQQAYFEEVRAKQAAQKQRLAELKAKQTLGGGVVGGLLGMMVGVIIWTIVTVVTLYHIGWIATIVGFCTGIGVRFLGKGLAIRSDYRFRGLAAALAGAGCLLGDALTALILTSRESGIPFLDLLLDPTVVAALPGAIFNVTSLLFYGIAMAVAFQTAVRPIPGELLDHA